MPRSCPAPRRACRPRRSDQAGLRELPRQRMLASRPIPQQDVHARPFSHPLAMTDDLAAGGLVAKGQPGTTPRRSASPRFPTCIKRASRTASASSACAASCRGVKRAASGHLLLLPQGRRRGDRRGRCGAAGRKRLGFVPEDGNRGRRLGQADHVPRRSKYQIVIESMESPAKARCWRCSRRPAGRSRPRGCSRASASGRCRSCPTSSAW
jgi:hypothetical protein